jgi:hypothetical protein
MEGIDVFWTIAALLLIPCLLVLQHARGRRLIHVLVVVALVVTSSAEGTI